jgi:hypothetical protein
MKCPPLLSSLALVICFGPQLVAQAAPPKDPCRAMPSAGTPAAKAFLSFDQFDNELRVALTKEDPVALSFLVRFPLRINEAEGTISLDDAGALKAHFQEIFNSGVRRAILADTGQHECKIEGVGYGRGEIWVDATDRGYAIWAVNPNALGQPSPERKKDRIEFTCQTSTYRIVVDTSTAGVLRYRSWKKPRPVTEPPDLEVANGTSTFEGTDFCAVPTYTFKNGGATYIVDGGMGCDGEPQVPKDATGTVDVQLRGKAIMSAYCY